MITFKTSVVCAGKPGILSFETSAWPVLLQLYFSQFLLHVQIVQVRASEQCWTGHLLLWNFVFVIFMSMSLQFVWVGFIKHFAQWKNKEERRTGQLANGTEIGREKNNQLHFYWMLIEDWRFWRYILKYSTINPSRVMHIMQNLS